MISITAGNAAWPNPAMRLFEMPLGDGALAVAYYKVEDVRVVLLHTEVPQELSGLGYGPRLTHGVFEALRRDGDEALRRDGDKE
jgi:predicted GNAT family acetyltransferase